MTEQTAIIQPGSANHNTLIDPHWLQAKQVADKPYLAHKDELYRVGHYVTWLDANGLDWHTPDLAAYRDYLLNDYAARGDKRGLAPSTVAAHLSTIRGRYNALLRSNGIRDQLYAMTPAQASPADRKAVVDEALTRLHNGIAAEGATVKVVQQQDVADSQHLRLSAAQLKSYLQAPGLDTLKGIRDTAMLALMACTGVREAELAALDVADLRQQLDGELALHVRSGKGAKARLIPYGDLSWCLVYVDRWLELAGITEGAVFVGFWKGGKSIRHNRVTVRTVIRTVQDYSVVIDGALRTVNPHDLRRTYAALQYAAGMPLLWISKNLGHADVKTIQRYIGDGSGKQRRAKGMIEIPHSNLDTRWTI